MSSVAEPEVQFAQKLASNEKPLRRKALKKLRSYISARSRSQTGFSEDELLKLWKGLFYCLWMQDKPLLQEELSTQISGLVHHFHTFSAQLLYMQTFLTTVKREWTGIDRLRMDKYFQLVRFMFRQMFEVLQRSQWEPSCISMFLELLLSAVLQTGAPPVGLQLHVLDLYLRELAVVGAQELSADQNFLFIEPFCKTAAKTKDRSLFRAICSSIFSTIIDQAPFAIQELMDELQEDSDSGQASDEPEEPEEALKSKKTQNKTKATKHINVNGLKAQSEEEDEDDDEDDDDGQSDSEKPFDEDVGPVLQFDYGAVADKLLELSSRHNTPSRNRQSLYKIIKVLRDLSQGSFPQDEYPEEVSTDEDDEDFGSRKRMKRRHTEEEEEVPEVKKAKGKNKPLPQCSEQNDDGNSEEVKKTKKRKKKKKKPQNQTEAPDTANSKSTLEPSLENGHTEMVPNVIKKKLNKTKGKEEQKKLSAPTDPKVTSAPSVTLHKTQEQSKSTANCTQEEAENTAPQKTPKKKKKKKPSSGSDHGEPESEHSEATNDPQAGDTVQTEQNKKKAQRKASKANPDHGGEKEKHQASDMPETIVKTCNKMEVTEKKNNLSQLKPQEDEGAEKKDQKKAFEDVPDTKEEEKPQDCETADSTLKTPKKRKMAGQKKKPSQLEPVEDAGTKKRKKRKIPVVFEYEADEVQVEELTADSPADPQTPVKTLRPHQKKQPAPSDFVSFQSSSPPAPLFCRARGRRPQSTQTKHATPKFDSKKVRFGLKNNQTAEFCKSDRSLLLSPEGTSRVPFDPEQRPKCGVLKSPPTPYPKQKKKTTAPSAQKKKRGSVPARPTAADFF